MGSDGSVTPARRQVEVPPHDDTDLVEVLKADLARIERENDRLRQAGKIAAGALLASARKLTHLSPHYQGRSGSELGRLAQEARTAAGGLMAAMDGKQ